MAVGRSVAQAEKCCLLDCRRSSHSQHIYLGTYLWLVTLTEHALIGFFALCALWSHIQSGLIMQPLGLLVLEGGYVPSSYSPIKPILPRLLVAMDEKGDGRGCVLIGGITVLAVE